MISRQLRSRRESQANHDGDNLVALSHCYAFDGWAGRRIDSGDLLADPFDGFVAHLQTGDHAVRRDAEQDQAALFVEHCADGFRDLTSSSVMLLNSSVSDSLTVTIVAIHS